MEKISKLIGLYDEDNFNDENVNDSEKKSRCEKWVIFFVTVSDFFKLFIYIRPFYPVCMNEERQKYLVSGVMTTMFVRAIWLNLDFESRKNSNLAKVKRFTMILSQQRSIRMNNYWIYAMISSSARKVLGPSFAFSTTRRSFSKWFALIGSS